MSSLTNLDTARARGIVLPDDDDVAQAILDEQEAWLARDLGPLVGTRSETFYVGLGETRAKLALARPTDSVTLTDGGTAVNAAHYRLVDNGLAVHRTYSAASQWWSGPYVVATYTPNDEDVIRSVLYDLIALAAEPASDKQSERIGDYSYARGMSGGPTRTALRAALISSLKPKRDPLLMIQAVSRRIGAADPVINRPEPEYGW